MLRALEYGFTQTYFWTKQIFIILGDLVTGGFSIDSLSGPVGIYKSTEEVAQQGIFVLMKWGAVLSINLGIMNLLPLPALDGGQTAVLLSRSFKRKTSRPSKRRIGPFYWLCIIDATNDCCHME